MRRIMKPISAAAPQPGFGEDTAADQDQGGSEYQRRRRFDAHMTVGVCRIGRGRGALGGGMDHEKTREQIGEGVQAEGNQRRRIGQPADNDLSDRQQRVDRDTDPGGALHLGSAIEPSPGWLHPMEMIETYSLCPILSNLSCNSRGLWES